jgi:DNA invertase Pin-like site-specific DNA recombinase
MNRKDRPAPEPTGQLIGYARVSTADQSVDMQMDALRRAGVPEDNLWFEVKSGVRARRPQLEMALTQAMRGDTFVVYKLDRLGRSLRDLMDKLEDLNKRGIGFRSLNEGIDTSTAIGRFAFHMLGALAQFERDLTVERTRDGMAAARRRGVRLGAIPKLSPEQEREAYDMLKAGQTVTAVAKHFKVTRPTLYARKRIKALVVRMQAKRRAARGS